MVQDEDKSLAMVGHLRRGEGKVRVTCDPTHTRTRDEKITICDGGNRNRHAAHTDLINVTSVFTIPDTI